MSYKDFFQERREKVRSSAEQRDPARRSGFSDLRNQKT
jgi:hypothetical protein